MADAKPQPLSEDELREELKGVFACLERLSPHIQTTEDLTNVIELALTSDAQLRFLLSLITGQQCSSRQQQHRSERSQESFQR